MDSQSLRSLVRTVADWPKAGVNFFDICSIVGHPEAFQWTVAELARFAHSAEIEAIVSPDARGFIWGAAVAFAARLPLHLARKPGKLPGDTVSKSYKYEYAETSISMQTSCSLKGKRVLIVDDVLATGGTALAIVSLLTSHFELSAERVCLANVINLSFLGGERRLRNRGIRVHSLLNCPHE